eukprot:1158892-Pelagomonas_calceolata.AAC.27
MPLPEMHLFTVPACSAFVSRCSKPDALLAIHPHDTSLCVAMPAHTAQVDNAPSPMPNLRCIRVMLIAVLFKPAPT